MPIAKPPPVNAITAKLLFIPFGKGREKEAEFIIIHDSDEAWSQPSIPSDHNTATLLTIRNAVFLLLHRIGVNTIGIITPRWAVP